MDFSYTPEQNAFREEVRTWMKANVPGDYGSKAWPIPKSHKEQLRVSKEWAAKLFEGGWSGITWPKQYGGRGATPIEHFIFLEEMTNYRVPGTIDVIGIGMGGPTVMTWGTTAQKDKHLKNILSGAETWCQGFSEPNAGSDVAGLKTTASDQGDHFLINGQKIWTSVAQLSDYCMLVTRTDPTSQKHKGLTYFIVDMKSKGLSLKPIKQITGDSEFNELYFDNVKVPRENILGQEGNGWAVAITTLMHERVNIAALLYTRIKQTLNDVVALTQKLKKNGRPLSEDPIVRKKLVYFYNNVETQRLNNLRMRAHLKGSDDPGPIGSIFKLIWAKANQDLLELPVDILGPYAEQLPGGAGYSDQVENWMKQFLRARANSIEGGTSEILRGIIADRVLNLPR